MKRLFLLLVIVSLAFSIGACKKGVDLNPVANPAALQVEFADAAWDGVKVPSGMQCKRFGGKDAASPALNVSALPAGTTKVIVRFNDLSFPPLSRNGGHGSIMVNVPAGSDSVTVPSVPGETYNIPEGVEVYKPHRATSRRVGKGAYLPPCSGGQGNNYQAVVLAVDYATGQVLGTAEIGIGQY